MSITRFRPEIWAAELLVPLRKRLVYAQPGVVNRDYEGEISEAGDTVRITSISDPTIGTYVPNVTVVTPEELTDAQRTLVVDQAKYFAFQVDNVDKRQAKGNVMPQAMSRAAYKLADQADQFVVALYTGAQAANALGTVSVTTAAIAEAQIIQLKVKLDEANVTTDGRYVAVPPWYHGLLLGSDHFVRLDAAGQGGGTDALRNGVVMRGFGFDILVSNNAPLVTGDDYAVMAGVPSAISFAEQINSVKAYEPEGKFADAVKGLYLYGAKLVRPDSIATLIASKT